MAKRAFIIHGWGGYPEEGWLPWLRKELASRGFEAATPAMPDPDHPKIDVWVPKLAEIVKEVDEETYLVGHSIGCQTILRYLETLPEGKRSAGVVLVAPWVTLSPWEHQTKGEREIYATWRDTPIDWGKVRDKAIKFTAIFCKDDPVVPFDENMPIFRDKLGAEIIVEEGKGHFSGSDGVTELPSALSELTSK